MRVKDIFSVFPRKLNLGKVVFYYQCYDDNGNRSSGLSTGQVTKTAARAYCMKLYRDGNFQKGRKDITKAYADNCRKMTKNQILPYFGKTRLDKITSEDINQWLLSFKERTVVNAEGKEVVKHSGMITV
jgi:hypothetical protein